MPRRRKSLIANIDQPATSAEDDENWWLEFLRHKGLMPQAVVLTIDDEAEFAEFLKKAVKVEPNAPKTLQEFRSLSIEEQKYWVETYNHYKIRKQIKESTTPSNTCRRCGKQLTLIVEKQRGYCMDCYFEMAGIKFGPTVKGFS